MSHRLPSRKPLLAATSAVCALLLAEQSAFAQWSVYEKNVAELEAAYAGGLTTSVNVVQQYLDRITAFNGGNLTGINAVAQVNPSALADAARIDSLIAGGATTSQYSLLGVPVLIKDSYSVQGLTTTNGVSVLNGVGTPGSTNFVSPYDAFSVKRLKDAGAIIIGKASQSTMAYSYNGVDNAHGVVLNPYSPKRSPGGSSSGSGAGIVSNFAMFAMGGETGGSIRVPANHNALVGLKTSNGLIDPGGTFPLTPARDVVGPLGKTVTDVAWAMNALVAPSDDNLFNNTPFYPDAKPGTVRPADYRDSLRSDALQGKVVAVPRNYSSPDVVHPLVLESFNRSLDAMRSQGATVVYVDVPGTDLYNSTIGGPSGGTTVGLPYDYPTRADGVTPDNSWSSQSAAFYYNKIIESYGDPTIKNIVDFATALEAGADAGAGDPRSPLRTRNVNSSGTVTFGGAAVNIRSLANLYEAGLAAGFGDADGDGAPDNPDALRALAAFASIRRDGYSGFMDNPMLPDDPSTPFDESTIARIDTFTAPTYGDVVPLQSFLLDPGETDPFRIAGESFASLLGRVEANILGAPGISVPMGYLPDGTPMGVQFMGDFLGEADILGYAYAYEQATLWRVAPDLSFVPEPATASVLVFSGFALASRRRRSSSSSRA